VAQRVDRGIALLFHDCSIRRGLDDVQCLIHNESHFTDVQHPEIFVVISAVLTEDSGGLLGCDAISLGTWFLMF